MAYSDRNQIVKSIRQWATTTTDALLDPSCQLFTIPEAKGFIGYRIFTHTAIVLGDPVCPAEEIPFLTIAFHRFCETQKVQIIYLMASDPFAQWAMTEVCRASVKFGDELYVNPQSDPRTLQGTHASLVRRKVRHAHQEGVLVKEYLERDASVDQSLQDLAGNWLRHRQGPQIHVSNVYLFEDVEGKRWFYAMQNEKVVGMVVLNRLESQQGWLINHLMLAPGAPHGTPELLIISALETLKQEGCHYASFGAVPAKALSEFQGFRPLTRYTIGAIYQIANRLFHFEGLRMFWGKFAPQAKPSYLLFSSPNIRFTDIKALFKATHASL